eukprot:531377-Pelagomonas_calceolata.AAC.5
MQQLLLRGLLVGDTAAASLRALSTFADALAHQCCAAAVDDAHVHPVITQSCLAQPQITPCGLRPILLRSARSLSMAPVRMT